jgi:hypothetical protein
MVSNVMIELFVPQQSCVALASNPALFRAGLLGNDVRVELIGIGHTLRYGCVKSRLGIFAEGLSGCMFAV